MGERTASGAALGRIARMVPSSDLSRRPAASVPGWLHVALVVVLVMCAPARLEPVRWWWSSPIVNSLVLTADQSRAIQQLYEDGLPARRLASENVISLTEKVEKRLRDGLYDDELLKLTSQLVNARGNDCEERRRSLLLSAKPLSEHQREKLMQLIHNRRVAE
jgi:hypothetical protein